MNSKTSIPPGAADRRIYHGHKVLVALFLAGFMVYGGGLYSFVLFVPPLTQEFHWSRAATSGLVTAFWLSAPMILLGGFAIKRAGAVRLLLAGIVIEALCMGLLPTVSSFGEMYLLRAAMGFGKVMFAVTLPYAISRWYVRHYSLGLGIAWSGWHVGGLVLAPLTGLIIANYGWRPACLAIAAGLLTVGLIPVLATQRFRSPREIGMGPEPRPVANEAPPSGSLADLLRSPMFWIIALVTLFFYSTYGGLLTQEAAVVEGAGFSPRLSSLVLGSTAGFAAVGGLSFGWILDRYSIRAAGVAIHLLLLAGSASLLLVGRSHSAAALVFYAICFGITIGASDLYFVAVLRRRFPNVSVAYSYSAWYFCEILTLLIAGPAAGRVFDLTGNYDATLALLAGSAGFALLLSLFVWRRPGLERLPAA
jgi:predicted MFS family arabinose efflux permease